MQAIHKRREDGFTLIEVIVAIALFVVIIPPIAGMIVSVGYINSKSNNYEIINGLAETKMESLRSRGYENLSNGTTDFSAELPIALGSPKSASYTVSDQDTTVKRIELTISNTMQGESETYSYTTYIGKNGMGQ